MPKPNPLFISGVLATATLLTTAVFAEPPQVVQRCIGCHNESGVTDHPEIPSLAGASDFYLENQLAVFEAGARPCVVEVLDDDVNKCALVGTLSDAQKSALVDHYAGQPYRPFDQDFDPQRAEQGAAIHQARCERCHTESGREPLDDAGLLAGQPISYLVRQLEYFTDGRRWQPESMAPQTEDLDSGQIRALAHFYARAGLEGAND